MPETGCNSFLRGRSWRHLELPKKQTHNMGYGLVGCSPCVVSTIMKLIGVIFVMFLHWARMPALFGMCEHALQRKNFFFPVGKLRKPT